MAPWSRHPHIRQHGDKNCSFAEVLGHWENGLPFSLFFSLKLIFSRHFFAA
jgi:hypothetical protein